MSVANSNFLQVIAKSHNIIRISEGIQSIPLYPSVKKEEIRELLDNLQNFTKREIMKKLKKYLEKTRDTSFPMLYMDPIQFTIERKLCPEFFEPIPERGVKSLHGYPIKEYTKFLSSYLSYWDFLLFQDIWNGKRWDDGRNPNCSIEEKINGACCSEFAKVDLSGNYYGGYYEYPEGSEENKNAYELTRKENIKALLGLPYPNNVKLAVIDAMCPAAEHSVAAVNGFCDALQRMMEKLSQK